MDFTCTPGCSEIHPPLMLFGGVTIDAADGSSRTGIGRRDPREPAA